MQHKELTQMYGLKGQAMVPGRKMLKVETHTLLLAIQFQVHTKG